MLRVWHTHVCITEAQGRGGFGNPRGLREHVAGPGSGVGPWSGLMRDARNDLGPALLGLVSVAADFNPVQGDVIE